MFRFTIRDVLWLTVVIGLVLSLWNERQKLNKSLPWREAAGALEAALTDAHDIDVSYNDGCVVVWGHPNGITRYVGKYELKGYEPSKELAAATSD